MIKRILIANRGEIAARIARTCRRLGIEYVTVHSEADAGAAYSDGAVANLLIGPAAPAESYLNIERLLEAARLADCDAVHPGYGFLSESATLARAVVEAGMIFVGPDAEIIAAMGDKARAKSMMAAAGLPVIPGSNLASDDPQCVTQMAHELGLPALLKPAAGGGGKGMESVENWDQLAKAIESSIRLARSSFGDGRLLVERLIRRPRHVEVQVFGDKSGDVVHLFERECSLQRRHQKIVEEAPAPNLDPRTREQLLSAALRGARAIRYCNAGTFEFIVGDDGSFYFLEVNTRLQVEHAITEEITGIDLVEWQIKVAGGETLPLAQSDIVARGHAIECRIYAEDPSMNFLPAPGRIIHVRWPSQLRVEAAIEDGEDVSPFYDPMIGKLVARGSDRAEALAAMRAALQQTSILGLTTNIGFLTALLNDEAVRAGDVHTRYVDENVDRLVGGGVDFASALACAASLRIAERRSFPQDSPWSGTQMVGSLDRSQLDPAAPLGRVALRHAGQWVSALLQSAAGETTSVIVEGTAVSETYTVTSRLGMDGVYTGHVNKVPWSGVTAADSIELVVAGWRFHFATTYEQVQSGSGARVAAAPMAGSVVQVTVNAGDKVARGDTLAVVEAMKMENPVVAQCDGVIEQVLVHVGDGVTGGQALVLMKVE